MRCDALDRVVTEDGTGISGHARRGTRLGPHIAYPPVPAAPRRTTRQPSVASELRSVVKLVQASVYEQFIRPHPRPFAVNTEREVWRCREHLRHTSCPLLAMLPPLRPRGEGAGG